MKILQILISMTVAILMASVISFALGLSPDLLYPIAGGLFALSMVIPRPMGALTTSLFDLSRPAGDNPGAGGGLDTEIILINAEDVDLANFPARAADGVTITGDIPLQSGKYMHRFYMTQGTIKPIQKMLKGANQDSGGYEVGVEGFYPGMEVAVQKWIASFGFSFKGFAIIQNCAGSTKYLLGEPCNLVTVDDLEGMWGEEVDNEKGSKFIFKGKQSAPMAIFEGAIEYDPSSASW